MSDNHGNFSHIGDGDHIYTCFSVGDIVTVVEDDRSSSPFRVRMHRRKGEDRLAYGREAGWSKPTAYDCTKRVDRQGRDRAPPPPRQSPKR
jgi:hypothetical protein